MMLNDPKRVEETGWKVRRNRPDRKGLERVGTLSDGFPQKQAAEESPAPGGHVGTFPIRKERRAAGISALKCRIQRQAAPKGREQGDTHERLLRRARAGSFGKRRNVVCPYLEPPPSTLRTFKLICLAGQTAFAGLVSVAVQASSADLKRTVQALQLK